MKRQPSAAPNSPLGMGCLAFFILFCLCFAAGNETYSHPGSWPNVILHWLAVRVPLLDFFAYYPWTRAVAVALIPMPLCLYAAMWVDGKYAQQVRRNMARKNARETRENETELQKLRDRDWALLHDSAALVRVLHKRSNAEQRDWLDWFHHAALYVFLPLSFSFFLYVVFFR